MTPRISIDVNTEETRDAQMRSSSDGSVFRRLFSRSPVRPERSTSSAPALGAETKPPQELATGAGQRGRTPPKSYQSQPAVGPEENPNLYAPLKIKETSLLLRI